MEWGLAKVLAKIFALTLERKISRRAITGEERCNYCPSSKCVRKTFSSSSQTSVKNQVGC